MKLDQATLRKLLHYDATTGILTWLTTRARGARAGTAAGHKRADGYIQIGVCGVIYPAHRLAWLWMTGTWPREQIDHQNGEHADNRWLNLRCVDRSTNQQNRRRANRNNISGLLGAAPTVGGFRARIFSSGKSKFLGIFATAEDAHAAYIKAKRELHQGNTL